MTSVKSFEDLIQKLNRQHIKLGLQTNAVLAQALVKTLTDAMAEHDPTFNAMFKQFEIAGSYADDLKIDAADEFDFVLTMKFPRVKQFEVKKIVPGYVKINASCLRKNPISPNERETVERVQSFLNNDGLLCKTRYLHWLKSLVSKALAGQFQTTINSKPVDLRDGVLRFEGSMYTVVDLGNHGPAITLRLTGASLMNRHVHFDLDFVFVLALDVDHWPSDRPISREVLDGRVHLVPKPYKLDQRMGDYYWICSYAQFERQYIKQKQKMKQLIRLFKQIRDRHQLTNLKSYYIKTIFLHHDAVQHKTVGRKYWERPLGQLFFEMLDVILNYVVVRSLPFFWDSDYNLFDQLNERQMLDIKRKLLKIQCRALDANAKKNWTDLEYIIVNSEPTMTRARSAATNSTSQKLPADSGSCSLQ